MNNYKVKEKIFYSSISLARNYGVASSVIFVVFVMSAFVLPMVKPYPYADDWSYIGYVIAPGFPDLGWLFSLHNDHRIPIQKLLHVTLLKLSGLDFRVLVALNYVCSVITALAWVSAARLVNGRKSVSDVIPCLLVLALGFNSVIWAFSFSFISSTMFISISVWLIVKFWLASSKNIAALIILTLVATAWSGGNGALCAMVLLFGYGYFLRNYIISWKVFISLILLIISLFFIIFGFSPSPASQVAPDLNKFIVFILEFSKAWMGIFAITFPSIKLAFAFLMLVVTILLASKDLKYQHFDKYKAAITFDKLIMLVFLILIMTTTLISVIAYSRAASQPWSPGLELHYGYLALLLPLSCWFLVSVSPIGAMRKYISILLILVSCVSYLVNATWRISSLKKEFAETISSIYDLKSTDTPNIVAKQHFKSMSWGDDSDDSNVSSLANGILLLRGQGIWTSIKK
jgi:hypothetical protein